MEQQDIEMQLWEYIDGLGTETERAAIARLIATDVQWQEQYSSFVALNAEIESAIETEQPSLRFSKNVMEAVAQAHIAPATNRYINPSVLKGIAAFFAISIVAVLVYAVGSVQWNLSANSFLPKVKPVDFHFGKHFNSTIVWIVFAINIILGLAFVDMRLRKKAVSDNS